MLPTTFFQKDACELAKALLGKVIFFYNEEHQLWLQAQIIETEAYYLAEKASHASLGFTEKRKALFMPAGTIYMYYSRGGDSLNISAEGAGNAVLIKSAFPYAQAKKYPAMIAAMQHNNPYKLRPEFSRPVEKLCAGQTLLCKSLGLKVKQWDQQQFSKEKFYIADINYQPKKIIQTTRLGIPDGRDGHLPYRFVDYDFAERCTINPLKKNRALNRFTEIATTKQ